MATTTSATNAASPSDALPWLLLAVTVTTGIVDAVSVIALGNVFVALMTGNIIFIGFALAGTPGFDAVRNAAALAAFVIGAGLAGRVGHALAGATRRRVLTTATAIEGVLILAAAAVAYAGDATPEQSGAAYYAVVALLGVAMGFRNSTVKKLGVADVPTTVMTLTLASLASDIASRQFKGLPRRLASIFCLLAGGFVGALLVMHAGVPAALLATVLVVAIGTAAYAAHPSSAQASSAH
jgi:uncharacterized membrane protein YoaK (UPF0700 family)